MHYVVKFPATENTREFFWFGSTGAEAAARAAQGYEVRAANFLQQAWETMKKPVALIDYGNKNFLLSFG